MKKTFVGGALICISVLFIPVHSARADMFGGDVAVLTQILANALQQLAQLRQMLQTGKDTLGFLQDINRGINDSLRMAETLGIRIDPGLYRGLNKVDDAVSTVERLFGRTVDSPRAAIFRNTDQTVGEAISFNNELSEYTRRLDILGEEIKRTSHSVSPGGASKLTAQSLGVMIHVMNQQMRATGQSLKLQAQALAINNKKDKDQTEQFINEGQQLKARLQSMNHSFEIPRF